jgi:hypothetical protein
MDYKKMIMSGTGEAPPQQYAVELLFPGTSTTAPNPTPNTGLAGDCTFSGPTPYYGADAASSANQAGAFGGGTTKGTIANHSSIDDVWSGGNFSTFDFYAMGYGGGNAGRIIDNRDAGGTGWVIFIRDSSVALAFLIQDSTGFKQWKMDNPLSLSTWYSGRLDFDSDDKANDPIITINGGAAEAITKISDTTGGATGPWGTDAGNPLFVGNNGDGTRGWNGRLDNTRVGI